MLFKFIILLQVLEIMSVDLDVIDCGVDHALDVAEGDVDVSQYPWIGILFYTFYGMEGDSRSITTVILIQKEFVVAAAADIGPMPKHNFRKNSRVLLGEGWDSPGRRVRNYVLHPEYGETLNTVALVQLATPVRDVPIAPVCPPPDILRNPVFYVIRMKDDFEVLQKEVVSVMHIPGKMCRDFYVAANLYSRKLRPPRVACSVARSGGVCVWGAGAALVARDVWGRWQLMGVGVHGPGCGAPSRYLDMMSYYPWIEDSLAKFNRLTISKISKQKYVLRSGSESYQKFGNCDDEEKINLVYRESIVLRTDNNQYQFLTYNLTIRDEVEYTCLTMELINASAVSEIRVKHRCPRENFGPVCYRYQGSVFDLSVFLMFSDKCLFEIFTWGFLKNMTLLDVQEWKWEEGTFYEDFTMQRVDYRGTYQMTDYGFEPLDLAVWVPDYDIWSTTTESNLTTTKQPGAASRTTPKRTTTPTIPTTTPRQPPRTKTSEKPKKKGRRR